MTSLTKIRNPKTKNFFHCRPSLWGF